MPIGASLHIGLNAVDPKHYSGWDGQLTAVRVRRKRHASVGEDPGIHQSNETPNEKGDTQPGSGRHQSRSGADSSRLARGVIFVISKGLCPRASHRDAATARVDN
jgi:hypothetical protein